MRSTLVVTALLGSALAAAPAAHADDQQSFRADYAGTASPTSTGMHFSDGTGLATGLGRITTAGDAVITGSGEATCPGGIANTNTQQLTAANGDTLTIRGLDVACPDGTPGGYDGTGRWTVVSGTGRLARVQGAGPLTGHLDLAHGTFELHLRGTLQ